jgi:L-2-hydroxyglutarate oxidase LhgO
MERIGVVGGGILGLAVARRLTRLRPGISVTVFEKEDSVARHQSGHNSGVVHAGLYYPPGSLKATLCRRGVGLLKDYCVERGLPYDECGKLVVALDPTELARLREIHRRGSENGVPDLTWLDGPALQEVEPHASGVAGVHSPRTAITDYPAICRALAQEVRDAGGEVRLRTRVVGIEQAAGAVRVTTDGGGCPTEPDEPVQLDALVLCAGLQSDSLARAAGDQDGPAIVPFRGEYLRLRPDRVGLLRGLIYPVPDPAYPFLGVHFTRRVDGGVDIGPNAVLALAKEGYRRRDLDLTELRDVLAWPGSRALARRHWRMGLAELAGSASRRVFLRRAQRYVPALRMADTEPGGSGVRAQAVDRDGSLVDDFRIHRFGAVTAVRNAPSPGATSSFAIAERICDALPG